MGPRERRKENHKGTKKIRQKDASFYSMTLDFFESSWFIFISGGERSHFRYKDADVERLRLKLQLLSVVLLNIGLVQWHTICFPVLNCHSCPVSIFACPLGIIGQFAGVGLVPLAVVGGIAVAGLIAGRNPLRMGLSIRFLAGPPVQGPILALQHARVDKVHQVPAFSLS